MSDPALHAPSYQPHLLLQGLSYDLDRPLLQPVGGEPISARAFRDMVSRYAQALLAAGARPGSRDDENLGPIGGEHPHPAADLIALVRERKGAVQTPKAIHFAPALPLTSLGKVDKKRLRAELTTGAKELNDV